MCKIHDLNHKIGCLKSKWILGTCSISSILFGILITILLYEHDIWLGFYTIVVGILMILVMFFPYKWMIFLSLIYQIIFTIVTGIGAYSGLDPMLDVIKSAEVTNHVFWLVCGIVLAFMLLTIFSILSIIVYFKALFCRSDSDGSSSEISGENTSEV